MSDDPSSLATGSGNDPQELQVDTSAASDPGPPGLGDKERRNLVRLLRVAYPHASFPDGPYERAARRIEDACLAGAEDAETLGDGLRALDSPSDFLQAGDKDALARVEAIAGGRFFALVHSATVVNLYDDAEVWELLGYEGSSFDKGGYLHRGFDDLDWLPDPRIEEYDGEPRTEIVKEQAR